MPEFPILVGHCDNGDPECCGIITPVVHGEQADLRCNECGVVIARVSATEAEPTLLQRDVPALPRTEHVPGLYIDGSVYMPPLRPRRRDSEVRTVSVQADPSRPAARNR